jgi:hypothetical protein
MATNVNPPRRIRESEGVLPERQITTKDVGLLDQLYREGQLRLAPEFQRNSVWPAPAKAYLIDTMLSDRPIPLLFFQRSTSPQTGRPVYAVIDGQQRLRSVFDFMDGRFRLTQSSTKGWANKYFEELSDANRERLLNYNFAVEELRGYTTKDIEDLFIRINKYVVRLSPQELRHARESGKFAEFVERLGTWAFWRESKVFSPSQLARMRSVEFSAELAILLIEGPQDKKSSVDLYYGQYQNRFPGSRAIETRLRNYIAWIKEAIPDLGRSRYRRPVDFYALVGALDRLNDRRRPPSKLNPQRAGQLWRTSSGERAQPDLLAKRPGMSSHRVDRPTTSRRARRGSRSSRNSSPVRERCESQSPKRLGTSTPDTSRGSMTSNVQLASLS